ncbi:hypothetical protein AAHE18_15G249700 [Arachis hypogaea]
MSKNILIRKFPKRLKKKKSLTHKDLAVGINSHYFLNLESFVIKIISLISLSSVITTPLASSSTHPITSLFCVFLLCSVVPLSLSLSAIASFPVFLFLSHFC